MSDSLQKIGQCRTAEEALATMCHWFYEDRLSAEGCEPVSADTLSQAYQELLVHNEHMTKKLEKYHGRPVELCVQHHRNDGEVYSRNVLLTLAGGDHVVEFGIVRIDLHFTPQDVRSEILKRETPLGDILINHDVLRRIEPRWFFRFAADSPMAAHFGKAHEGDVYGRVGTIYCDDAPAIELLEVVTEAKAV